MRLGVFDGNRLAVSTDTEVIDVTDLVPGPGTPQGPLHRLLEHDLFDDVTAPAALRAAPRIDPEKVAWSAPLPRPHKIIGAPANYRAHVAEMNNPNTIAEWGVFLKAGSSVIGPDELVRLPYSDVRTDQEAELGVVIGRRARNVSRADALDHVFGYTCVLDITIRSTEDRSTRKSFDTFTPIGPWVVTKDEVGDPDDLELRCWVNGEQRQHSRTSLMIYSVPRLIEYASSVMTLMPGDVIATGTPEGVGPLAGGDRVAMEVEKVGRLEVGVTADGALPYTSRLGRDTK
ncbi:fumarylacetoacetate hydrolase family protein [Streptomyces griseoflavus]|uniref:fumarylacetoacetate hydrolase family protein n=1 Tax=Streptomyces griseoflavus TaxID=35619 RepID=UPI0033A13273